MNSVPCWLLTDPSGASLIEGRMWRRWGRSVTHREAGPVIAGYACDSPHLPYLLDPIHDRLGVTARLWLAEVPAPLHLDPNRIRGAAWTTWDEWERPAWVAGVADVRVRLRLALMASAEAHPHPSFRARLRNLPVADLKTAAVRLEKICADAAALIGRAPQAICLAAMAVRLAARRESGEPDLADIPARKYPLHAWYAAMAAACACTDLSPLADAAVRQECGRAMSAAVTMEATV